MHFTHHSFLVGLNATLLWIVSIPCVMCLSILCVDSNRSNSIQHVSREPAPTCRGDALCSTCTSICDCTKVGIDSNYHVLCIHILHKSYLVVMYMYGGPIKHAQHLYASITRV